MTKFNILVVEDEDAIRAMLEMILQQSDFVVTSRIDAKAAQLALEIEQPDLILLDWMLPGLTGVEWARRLKKDESLKEIPIILLTAKGEEEDKVRGLEIGADDYITKPFSPKELVARIRAVLRRSGKMQEMSQIIFGDLVLDAAETDGPQSVGFDPALNADRRHQRRSNLGPSAKELQTPHLFAGLEIVDGAAVQ